MQSADREIRLLFPEYFNEGLSVQRSMEDMEDDHRLVGGEWEDANLFILYNLFRNAKLKDAKALLQLTQGECFALFFYLFFCFVCL
jgi:hypothetical protein